jgi:hypothetical protein
VGEIKGGLMEPAGAAATLLLTKCGPRVPTFVVSPWVPPGTGPDIRGVPTRIETAPISSKQMLGDDVEFDELTGMLARILLGR